MFIRLATESHIQGTLTTGGMITKRLLSSLTELDLTKQENMLLFVCSETTESKPRQTGDQAYSETSPYVECTLLYSVARKTEPHHCPRVHLYH